MAGSHVPLADPPTPDDARMFAAVSDAIADGAVAQPSSPPGTAVGARAALLQAIRAAPALADASYQLTESELTEATREALVMLQLAEAAAVGLVKEAIGRGIIEVSTAAGAAQWVQRLSAPAGEETSAVADSAGTARTHRAGPLMDYNGAPDASVGSGDDVSSVNPADGLPRVPGLEPSHARRIGWLATACQHSRNAVVDQAIREGKVALTTARTALEQVDAVRAVLPSTSRDEVLGWFLSLPPGAGVKGVRELTRRLVATYGPEDALDQEEARQDLYEYATFTDLPNGLVQLMAELTRAHAEELQHAIGSLSAPSTPSDCCDNPFHRHTGGEHARSSRSSSAASDPDLRSPGKRRADALVALTRWGAQHADSDGSIKTKGSARVVVTMDFETLAERLKGSGTTEAGVTIDPTTIRRMACAAEIIPIVLGKDGEPLDVGRAERLVSPGLRRAVIQRDRCCSFPGCDRPPAWCDVHHVVPWQAGGPTCLANSALLCERHHTIVHRDRLTADVTSTEVRWDLRPGRMAIGAGDAVD